MENECAQASLKVIKLYKTFCGRWTKEGGPPIFRFKDKWWKHFVKTIDMFGKEPEFFIEFFIDSIFEKKGAVYPQQLHNQKAWEDYLEYYKAIRKEMLDISKKMASDYIAIQNLMKLRNYDNLQEALKDKFIDDMIVRQGLDDLFLSFSRTFTRGYVDEEVSRKKTIAFRHKTIRNFVIEKHKDDLFIDDMGSYQKRKI